MNKAKYYKPPKPSTLPQKPIDQQSRPEFTTDFSQKNKYKLSQGQMIQRKASLQSKNKQIARQELAERRRKLEMGIIDQDTRPVFQTALTSKKIELNPTLRRNLSQMIQYQRQRNKSQSRRNNSKDNQRCTQENQENQDNFEQEVKNTQKFIKKLEKVKKQNNIQKAVDFMMKDSQNENKSSNFGPTKILNNETINKNSYVQDLNSSTLSQQQRLSNIQETIKFMQQKLFNPNWKKDKKQEKETNYNHEKQKNKTTPKIQQSSSNLFIKNQSQNYLSSNKQNPYFYTVEYSKIESLGSDEKQDESVDIQDLASLKLNLQTSPNINNLYLNNYTLDDAQITKNIQKQNNHLKSNQLSSKWKTNRSNNKTDQQPQVDFSLTLNDQLEQSNTNTQNFIHFNNTNKSTNNYYEELKKTLFQDVQQPQIKQKTFGGTNNSGFGRTSELQQQQEQFEDEQCSNDYFFISKPQNSVQQTYKQQNSSNLQSTFKNCPINKQLQKLKNMVEGTKNNVNRNYSELNSASNSNTTKPLGSSFDYSLPSNTSKPGVMGFDYRGSINIKKHIVNHNS